MNNRSSYCGLVDAKIRASDKGLPVFWQSFSLDEDEGNEKWTKNHKTYSVHCKKMSTENWKN